MKSGEPAKKGFVVFPEGRRLAFEVRSGARKGARERVGARERGVAETPILLVRPLGGSKVRVCFQRLLPTSTPGGTGHVR